MSTKGKAKSLSNNVILKWIIENFLACPQEYNCPLNCSPFLLRHSEIQMKLFTRGVSDDSRKFISFFLEMKKVGEVELDCFLDVTDIEENSLACQEFRIMPCEQKVELGFSKLVSTETVLSMIARSKSDTLIVKCCLKNIQSKTYPVTESFLVARTVIGVNRCSFTWYLENFDSNYTMTKIMYFPEATKMEFNFINSQYSIEIAIIKWIDDDDTDDDEKDRDGDYGLDYEGSGRSLLFKISLSTVEGEEVFTYQDWMDFYPHDEESECYFHIFKKERFELSFNQTVSLKCEISITCGTYLKHFPPKRLTRK